MIAGDEADTNEDVASVEEPTRRRGSRKNVSRYFQAAIKVPPPILITLPTTSQKPRTVAGFNIDDLSSDSSLTDVPSDIGSDPFESPGSTSTRLTVKSVQAKGPTRSPYFPNKVRPRFLSCLPFPPLTDKTFGIMQERLAHDPFKLLIATIFLNKTPGERAMPVFFQLMERYPTVADLAKAEVGDVTEIIRKLGFQNQRARKCVAMAKMWRESPPTKGRRLRKLNYPTKGNGRDIDSDEAIGDDDPRVAWEISHLPGLGPYSHDSWRMFCRDKLRGVADSWNGEGATEWFEPEWKRVVPLDKELRAWLTWVWLKEGWVWNKETGQRTKADKALLDRVRGGGIVKEEYGGEHLIIQAGPGVEPADAAERPAGDFMI